MTLAELRKKLEQFDGQEVVVEGWIRTTRSSKSIGFIELSDGSTFQSVQIVFEEAQLDNFSEVTKWNVGAALKIEGVVVLTPDAKQPFEINANKVTLEGASTPDYPLQKKRHSLEFLRSISYLRPRTNTFQAVFRVRSVAAYAVHSFFQENGFVYVNTPLITANDGEGAGEMFRVTTLDPKNPPLTESGAVNYEDDFFGKQTGLTVTGQLEGEAMAQAFGRIYTFGPTFRAEHSNTPRHAAEFWMIEPEMAFCDLNGDMEVAEGMVKYVLAEVMEKCPDEMKFFGNFVDKGLLERLDHVVSSPFDRITYTDAVKELEKYNNQFEFPVSWGIDLQTEHERFLTEQICKRPVFVTDYPKEIKAFYMRINEDGKTVAATDLLVPGIGELVGGSQREERYDVLLEIMKSKDMNIEDYQWYLDLRKYGTTTHAGFGLGFERLIMYLTGMQNIRDVIPFPRTTGSCEF